ncbi:hypothetical protein A2U01_0039744, partial [Trifolium medium]|nr:hypothetical protein [Trifolium medium]
MTSFFPYFGGYGATISCGSAVAYTGGGVDTTCGLSCIVGSVEGSILSLAVSTFLLRSFIALLCSSLMLDTSFA